ncbi:MAG: glycosyltransferase family 39 protein [Phycisphaerae bacterium]|nr:glycosyltransferase family 39 protein [Phycisphaerae bacterium]
MPRSVDADATRPPRSAPPPNDVRSRAIRPSRAEPFPFPVTLQTRLAAWYEKHPRPFGVIALVVLALYLPTLAVPFFIDDYRCLRLMEEYRAGARQRLDLYRFFTGPADNAAQRLAGLTHWWLSDNLRFAYVRPLAEWSLYLDYRLFGNHPAGYRAVSIALYLVSVALVLAIFREIQPNEARARWAALLFALASSHAVPIVFIAARCDVLSLLGLAFAMFAALRFVRSARMRWLPSAAVGYAVALLSKESAATGGLGLVLLWLAARMVLPADARPRADRRAVLAFLALLATAVGWSLYRAAEHVAINTHYVNNPLRDPATYVAEAPVRALMYLSTWLIPINPAVLMYHSSGYPKLVAFLILGAIALAATTRYFVRYHRRDPSVLGMAGWVLIFLPVLVCALPDERLMTLPSVGLAYLGAVWIRHALDPTRRFSRFWRRRIPVTSFVAIPIIATLISSGLIYGLEYKIASDVRYVVRDTNRAGSRPAEIFFVNAPQPIHAIWHQDRARTLLGRDDQTFYFLCDLPDVEARVTGPDTLRLTSVGDPFLSMLLGQFGLPSDARVEQGQTFEMKPFRVRVVESRDGRPTILDLIFAEPLTSPRYAFYHLANDVPPTRWNPVAGASGTFGAFAERTRIQPVVPPRSPAPP